MKKFFLLTAMIIATTTLSSAITIDDFCGKYSKAQDATVLKLDKNTLAMAMSLNKVNDIIKQIDEIVIISLENCSNPGKENFADDFKMIKDKSYKTFVKNNEANEKAHILIKENEGLINSMVIISIDEKDCAIVKITGNIAMSSIDSLVGSMKF
ncbi:MAG: DUF4252 domain-containing protein [Muribaculaceae bacterium]